MRTQKYANSEKRAVIINTENSSMRLLSPSGTESTHTELIAKRLNAAEPTIVLAPSSPGSCASQPH